MFRNETYNYDTKIYFMKEKQRFKLLTWNVCTSFQNFTKYRVPITRQSG